MSVDNTRAADEGNPEDKLHHRDRCPSSDNLRNCDDGAMVCKDRPEDLTARRSARFGVFLLDDCHDDLDVEEVARTFKDSADLGDFCGMFAYGDILMNGLGVDKNPEEAARYYKLAAD